MSKIKRRRRRREGRLDPEDKRAGAAARIRSIIAQSIADSSITAPAGGAQDVRTVSISAGEGEALTRWVLREKAIKTIEIGLAYGVSALYILKGLIESGNPDARHVVLDRFKREDSPTVGSRFSRRRA